MCLLQSKSQEAAIQQVIICENVRPTSKHKRTFLTVITESHPLYCLSTHVFQYWSARLKSNIIPNMFHPKLLFVLFYFFLSL